MDVKSCTQKQCSYHPSNNKKVMMEITDGKSINMDTQDLCPECSDCGCPPHEIDEDCTNCWNCLKDEGYVRNGTSKFIKEALKKFIKYSMPEEEIKGPTTPMREEKIIR